MHPSCSDTTLAIVIVANKRIQDGRAHYVACHNESYVETNKFDVVRFIKRGGTFFLNTKIAAMHPDRRLKALEAKMSPKILRTLALRGVKFYIMDAASLAAKYGLKGKINMICTSAFFRLSGVLPIEEAILLLKESITKTYSYKGEDVVRKNHELLDGQFLKCSIVFSYQLYQSHVMASLSFTIHSLL